VIDEQCVASGLSADAVYEAVVKFKTRSGWSEQSNASPPLKLSSLRLPRPGAPVLEGVSATSIRVKYASSPGTAHVDVWVRADGDEWKSSESTDGSLVEPPCKQAWRPGEDVVLTGLTADTYRVKLVAQNAFGWGDKGPESQPLRLSSLRLPGPGAPLLEGVSETSIRVKYVALPGTTHVDVWVKANGDEWKSSESTDGSLVEPPCKQAWRPGEDVVLTGLTADTSYRVKLVAQNAFGWGDKGPESQPLKLEDSSSPTFLGSTSWAERDAAARKRAIDVDDVGTSAQHVKTESKIAKKTPARKARK